MKKDGIAQGLFETVVSLVNKSYIMYINTPVATTERIEPKLDTAFQYAKASG